LLFVFTHSRLFIELQQLDQDANRQEHQKQQNVHTAHLLSESESSARIAEPFSVSNIQHHMSNKTVTESKIQEKQLAEIAYCRAAYFRMLRKK